ncbi:MAG: hypothetical protein KGJ13_09760 [Patescibacteria group bacterium]|nr:hypothetical protein [Patescibacteria group bacterium]
MLNDPGLGLKAQSSPTVTYKNAFRFVAGGLVSNLIASADAPNLEDALLIAPYPNGSTDDIVGTLAGDNGSTNTGIKCSRIYALIADLNTNDGSTAPTFSWLAGPDFTKYEYPSDAYFPKANKSTQAVIGYVWITNAASTAFTPGTTDLDAAGVTTVFLSEPTDASGVMNAKVSLTSAQILALHATPITLLPTLPTTQCYDLIAVTGRMNFLTAAYATNTQLDISDKTSGTVLFEDTGTLLAATATLVAKMEAAIASNAANTVTAGGAVEAIVATGNPATGAGSLDLYLTYRVITL